MLTSFLIAREYLGAPSLPDVILKEVFQSDAPFSDLSWLPQGREEFVSKVARMEEAGMTLQRFFKSIKTNPKLESCELVAQVVP